MQTPTRSRWRRSDGSRVDLKDCKDKGDVVTAGWPKCTRLLLIGWGDDWQYWRQSVVAKWRSEVNGGLHTVPRLRLSSEKTLSFSVKDGDKNTMRTVEIHMNWILSPSHRAREVKSWSTDPHPLLLIIIFLYKIMCTLKSVCTVFCFCQTHQINLWKTWCTVCS